MADTVNLDGGSWPAPLGSAANDRTSRAALSAEGQVRWRVDIPYQRVAAISVGADGTCFLSAREGITAMDGPAVRWSADTAAPWTPLLLDNGLLVTGEADGYVVREQRTGVVVSAIEARLLNDPALLPNGLLAFVTSRQGKGLLRASTLAGEANWEHPLDNWSTGPPLVQGDHVIVAGGAVLHAFDGDGSPVWTVDLREVGPDTAGLRVEGHLVGLPGGDILVAVRSDDMSGYLVVDPRRGEVRALPAHLPPKALVAPLRDAELGRELLVVPGWPERAGGGEFRPVVTVVDIGSGAEEFRHVVPAAPRSMVVGSTGLVAVAGSPDADRWAKYQSSPGLGVADECYVLFLDKSGVRGEWRPGKPVTGPLAIGMDGELLVPVSGELCGIE